MSDLVWNDFDATCRRMVHASAEAFLPYLITGFAKVARQTGWVDTRRIPFPGHPDQTGDLVFELAELDAAAPPWAVALEFQIEPDARMFGWLMTFLGTIVNERRPDTSRGSEYQLAAIVVNLTGTRHSTPATRRFVWPGKSKQPRCALTVWELYLADESAKQTLERVARKRYHAALLPWVPLMVGGSEVATIARTLQLAAQQLPEKQHANFAYHTRVLAEKSADPDAWYNALEGWGMVRSITMEATRQEGRQDSLLRVLRGRTREEVPDDLVQIIRACRDSGRVNAWLDIAIQIDTLEQFREQAGV